MALLEPQIFSGTRKVQAARAHIYINERVSINLSRSERASGVAIFGKAGGGKSVLASIILSQFPNAIYLDPKPGNQAWKTLNEIGESDSWEKFEIHDTSFGKRNSIKINVGEIYAGVINVLCIKKESSFDTRLRRMLWPFFALPKNHPNKTFNNFEKLLVTNGFDSLVDEFKVVLDESDSGMSIDELCRGRKAISIADFDSDNRGISLMLGNIFYHRGHKFASRESSSIPWNERLAIACDECHTHVKSNSTIGSAMGYVFSQGRAFGITGMVLGTNEEFLPTTIKSNIQLYFFFDTPQERDKFFKKYGVDIDPEIFEYLNSQHPEGGNCFFKGEDYGYVDAVPIHVNYYYQKLKSRESDERILDFSAYV